MFLLRRMSCALLAIVVYGLSVRAPALAHVKWFNEAYCVACSPPPLHRIFDKLWFLAFGFFALLSLCAFILDRMYSTPADQYVEPWLATIRARSEDYLRIGLGFFLLCVSIRR